MGKREETKKPRQPRDWYGTRDPAAVAALAPFLWSHTRYIEPCAGDGNLIDLLASSGPPVTCVAAYDIDPQRADVKQKNCLFLTGADVKGAGCFITNPPYEWSMLQPMLEYLPTLLPTWLLLPADMAFNKRMSDYMKQADKFVAVGRLWWFENEDGKKIKGVDNFAWIRFTNAEQKTKFYSR
jgi:hypothetical protein